MSSSQEWTIVFYADANGNSPPKDFYESLDKATYARFLRSIEQLRVRNVSAREPLVKHIEGKLWELRQTSNDNIYRLMYFFFTGRKIVFVHGFQKKTQKTPRGEIEIAQRRMADFLKRQET